MKKMFVVYGKMNSGKTHTMWFLFCHMLAQGAKIIDLYHVSEPFSYEKVMVTKTQLPDFRVLLEWKGKKIMLLSAGDYLAHYYWGFRLHVEWAIKQQVDYVVCCSRSRNNDGSIYKELMEVYRGKVLSDEDWFWVEKADKDSDWLQERDKTAKAILSRLQNSIEIENRPKSTIEFLWRISQQLVVAKDKEMHDITGFGSGFFMTHEGSLFFVTADHVLHWDDHEVGERISKDSYLFIANNKKGEGLTSAYTPLGGFYYFDKYDFADLFAGKDINPEVAAIPDLQDFAFCLRKNEFQCQFYTHELSDCNGSVIVPSNLEKLIISSQAAIAPNKEDYYIVAGSVMYNILGARIDRCNAVHQDMKFDRIEGENIILESPENIIYEHWAGISGSPVLNQNGKLLGVIVRVNCTNNEVTVIPIDKILHVMKNAIDIENINHVNKF